MNDLPLLIVLCVAGMIVLVIGLKKRLANANKGSPSQSHMKIVKLRKFVKERQWGIVLLALFGVSSMTIAILSNLDRTNQVGPSYPWHSYPPMVNLEWSGINPNLTRTGYAVTLSQYGAPRLFDPAYRGNTTGTSVWGLSVNQMRFVYFGMDDMWHETSFQLNEEGWKWIANGSISYTNAGTRPNTLLEEMQWAHGYVPSQFYPDLPNYYYPDAPKANLNAPASSTTGGYGGRLPIDNNATMMDNWPEYHQTQAMEAWAGGTPDNNSQVRGAVDHDDELVFLAQNGQKVLQTNWYRNDLWPHRVEIDIIDPVDNGHSWVYLYYNPTAYATQPTPRNSISADYCRTDSYIAPGESSSVNWNPTTGMIVATNYQMQVNPTNAADFLNLKITVPGLLQTDILQEFPKDFMWVDGRLNFGGTTSLSAVRVGLAFKYGLSGTWYQAGPPGIAALAGNTPSDAPRAYNNVNAHVGVFYNRGNPDQTENPAYGEPPYTTTTGAMGWMDGTGAKVPVYYSFPTGPALGTSPPLGPLAVREQWTTFAGTYEPNTATDYAGYCFNDSAYWVYSRGALATASGTTAGTWNQILSPFQDNLALDGGAFNDKAAIINGPVMAYISRISCLRVVISFSWLHYINAALYGVYAQTNPGAGYVEGYEFYTQQDLAVFPNAFYQYNISYPVPQLPANLVQAGVALDHMWAFFNMFQVARGIETAAPGTLLYLGQGVANDSSSPALSQMSAAMNLLSNSVAGRFFIMRHGFPSFKHIQQLASDNTAFYYNNYPMWSWATNVTKALAGYFPKVLTFNNNSADDTANGYTATNTMGRAGFTTGTAQYHPWWDTSGAAPFQEQWIDNTVWRDSDLFNQNGGAGASQTIHGAYGQATPREMIPMTPRETANTNVAPDWAILHVPNAGDVWVYMPQRECSEIKSHYDQTWQPAHATADDSALAFKDNSSNVRTRIGDQEFGLFMNKLALGNSVIPYTVAIVFGNFNITSTASANLYGEREWVRNRLPLSLIFVLVHQKMPRFAVTSFGLMNHGPFYKTGDVVNMTVLTDYPGTGSGIPAMTTEICTGLNGYTTAPVISNGGVGVLVGTINGTRNEYRYTIQFTITSVPAEGDNVGLTLGTRHDFYYASVTGSATYVPNATCGIFFDHTAPAAATFSLPATTRSTAVTIDWTAHPGMDNSDGTLKDGSGNPLSGIANYTVLRNGVPVATITGPGNGGTTFSYVDTNGGSAFTNGQVLEYCLLTSDMAGNVGTSGTVQTTISLPFTPGAFDAMIPSASSVPFQLRWVNNPGSGIITGYSILRSLTVSNSYTMIATLASTVRSWTQSFGTGNASLINADDTYWYILQSTNGATTINNTPISVIRDTTAPNPASILPLTSPYKPTTYTIPIDITGPGKAIDPGFYSTGDLSNVGSGVAIYTVWRCVNPGTGWQVPVNRGTVTPGIIESNVWYDVDPGLVNMYSYKYWVTSTDNAGNTVNSTAIQFTFSTANINPAGALKILQVTTNVTTCQRGRWIGYIVKLQNIGSLSTTINTLPVAVLFGGIDETSQYTIYGNFTADATINAYATRYYLFRIRPSAGADLGRVLINATTTWSLVNKDWSKQPASVTIQATMIDLIPAAPPLVIAMGRNMQVELKWVVPASNGGSAITNYRIYQGTTPGGETLLATVGNMLTFTSTALTNGQMYYFKISAVNCVGESDTSPETSAIPAVVPSTPVGLTATTVNMQVILKWEPPISNGSAAVTSYRIYRGTSPGNETFLMAIGNVTTYTATELTYGQVYYFHVSAMNTLGESPPSNEVSAYLVTVPSAPTGLSLVPGAKQIVLNWVTPASNGGATITNYHIYQGTSSNNETLLATIGSYTTYTSTGLANGQVYFYQVTAMSVAGESARSIEANTTTATVPGVPTALTATRGNAQVVLNWVAPTSNGGTAITSYSIYCGTLSSSVSLLATIGNITTYTSTGLANGQIYYYEVTAVNVAGESVKSAEASATPATVPGAPTGLALTPSNAQIVLNWVAPASDGGSAITGYNVYRSLTSGTETLLISLSVVLTYTNVGLTNGQIYYYVVTAVNAMGESVKSAETGAKPVTVPGALTGLLLTPGNAQIVLIWVAPSNNGGSAITNYRIYRGTSSGFETLLTTLGVVLTYTNTGLTNGQLYYYQVSAMNAMGEGARSSEASVWPQAAPTPPSAPTRLTATPGNSIVLLNWSTPASNGGSVITGYCVYQGKTWGTETLMMTISVVLACTSGVLTNGQVYYFQVSAVNAVGEGPRSDEANAMPRTVPEAPRNLKATSGDKQAVLSWQEPISNGGLPIVNYTIYRGTSKDNKILLAIIDNRTSYTDINVINGQVYYYEIHAANEAGEGTTSNEAQVIPANPTVFDYSRINPISNSILVLTISLLGIGAVISISTIVIARKLKIKHKPPTTVSAIATASTRSATSTIISMQPLAGTSADRQAGISAHVPLEAGPTENKIYNVALESCPITPSIMSSINVDAPFSVGAPEINHVTERSVLLVSQADLHALDEIKVSLESTRMAVRCNSCNPHEDTKLVPFNEKILLACKKCMQPVTVVVKCVNCFGGFTITQDELYSTRDARFQCPICREITNIMQ
ncbi:MAG TPA: fibronectin type III domain-containing protein [Candidatus Lokiarchaeia archaeon]|nr:fibronectin type III domain-containing protein [Candidatus Lokiarchaeia archaeon]